MTEDLRTSLRRVVRDTTITDWLLVAVTVALAFFTWQLERVAKKTDEAIHNSADALRRSADATTAASSAATKSAEAADAANNLNTVALRPWVYFEKTFLDSDIEIDAETLTIVLNYILKNTGHTPAMNVDARFMMSLLSSPPSEDYITGIQHDLCRTKVERQTGATIFPDQTLTGLD